MLFIKVFLNQSKTKSDSNVMHLQIFTGNTDKGIVVSNTFVTPIVAKHVRIHAGQYYKVNIVCLRLELYGCPWKDTGQGLYPHCEMKNFCNVPDLSARLRIRSQFSHMLLKF